MTVIAMLALLLAGGVSAGSAGQRVEAGRIPASPPPVDPKILSLNGGDGTGQRFRPGDLIVLRGQGLGRPVMAWLRSTRTVKGQVKTTGSLLQVVRVSDHQLVLRISGTRAGGRLLRAPQHL